MSRGRLLVLLVGWLMAAPTPAEPRPGEDPEVQAFVLEMSRKHGFGLQSLTTLFGQARFAQEVLDAFARPAESKPWHQYRPIFVTPVRTAWGIEFWDENIALLERAERTYEVPAEIIVAIIGVETNYGRRTGSIRALDALTTLTFRYPRRSAFFRRELEAFLLLALEEDLDAAAAVGSYAGALGIPQFIPSSYRAYSVDFDGDGRRDLIGSTADAIGSVANYLKRHHWEGGGPIAVPVRVDGEGYREVLALGLKPQLSPSALAAKGVRIERPPPEGTRAALISLENETGEEYWAGFQNFYAITRYNPSKLYGMAVYQLADGIRQARAARTTESGRN